MAHNIERLECVYYPGPIPFDGAALTALCLVFDKMHFPGVYLPKGDYDKALLQEEISRLEALKPRSPDTDRLIDILDFPVLGRKRHRTAILLLRGRRSAPRNPREGTSG
jgi:hypothetical protein